MTVPRLSLAALFCLGAGLVIASLSARPDPRQVVPDSRREVVFWHFWGGADRQVVEQVVERFNQSQDRHFVRAIAMPGNNLDMKLFLAVTGGDPPDLVNQDDPIMADWAARGALLPLDEVASPAEIEQLRQRLVPAALRLGGYHGRLYGLCNGLDVRAIFYNKTLLNQHGLSPPQTLDELDEIAERTTIVNQDGRVERFGYLPDPRRLWAWGVVFGGQFYEARTGRVTADSKPIVEALTWMTSYRQRYGAREIAAFRQGDQSLPGKTFPLLAGRYVAVMDGQWRVRDIAAAQEQQRRAGKPVTEYGVCPLPPPNGGVSRAGWVNGNFFLLPRGARNAEGAWEFMKFWVGLGGREDEAAATCASGGWIPVLRGVSMQPDFQQYLKGQPLFAELVALSESPQQVPTPVIPGAGYFYRTINEAAAKAMYVEDAPSPAAILHRAAADIQSHLDALQRAR